VSPKLTTDFTEAIDESGKPAFTKQEGNTLRARLPVLLSPDSNLGITVKANEVFTDHYRAFIDSSIITDIRTIFKSDPNATPAGACIVHMLKIEYGDRGHNGTFFVAMDASDVIKLKKLLERSELEAQQLKRMLANNDLRNLEE
jgi:hypothetical protein